MSKKKNPKQIVDALYKASDALESFFDSYCHKDERRADHSVLTLRASINEYADYLTRRFDLDIEF